MSDFGACLQSILALDCADILKNPSSMPSTSACAGIEMGALQKWAELPENADKKEQFMEKLNGCTEALTPEQIEAMKAAKSGDGPTDALVKENGEEYCQSGDMTKESCEASTCCHWNTKEKGEASNFGAGRCWSSIGQDPCTDGADVKAAPKLTAPQMANADACHVSIMTLDCADIEKHRDWSSLLKGASACEGVDEDLLVKWGDLTENADRKKKLMEKLMQCHKDKKAAPAQDVESCQKVVWEAVQDCDVSDKEMSETMEACEDISPEDKEIISKAAWTYMSNNCQQNGGDTVEGCQKEIWSAIQDCNVSDKETHAMVNACDDLSPEDQKTAARAATAYYRSNCENQSASGGSGSGSSSGSGSGSSSGSGSGSINEEDSFMQTNQRLKAANKILRQTLKSLAEN